MNRTSRSCATHGLLLSRQTDGNLSLNLDVSLLSVVSIKGRFNMPLRIILITDQLARFLVGMLNSDIYDNVLDKPLTLTYPCG